MHLGHGIEQSFKSGLAWASPLSDKSRFYKEKTALPKWKGDSFFLTAYFLSKLSQQVQLSASQEQVFPTWILRKVQ